MDINVEYEIDKLKKMIEDEKLTTISDFVLCDDYEFDYSHSEIGDIQDEFAHEAEEFLKENYPGKYVILTGYPDCVYVATIQYYKERNIKGGVVC